jgi:AcrR family transcriptional regulator
LAPKKQTARERILSAAIREISARGWGATVRQIAASAKVNQVTVYRLFESTDNLKREALREVSQRNEMAAYLEYILSRDHVPPPSEAMAEMVRLAIGPTANYIRMIIAATTQNPKLVASWNLDSDRPHIKPLLAKYAARLQAQGDMGRSASPEDWANMIVNNLLGNFVRNVLLAGTEYADADPLLPAGD